MSNYQYFSIDDCIRGYHIYKDILTAPIGDYLACKPEFGNLHDPYAVAVVTTNDVTVGHLPLCISTVSHLFLRKNESIICQVTGRRRYSADLFKEALKYPAQLLFLVVLRK